MNWQNSGYNLGDATLGATQDRPVLQSFVSLYQRARRARLGLGSHNQTPPRFPGRRPGRPIPPPSVGAVVPPCPAPHSGHIDETGQACDLHPNPLGGSP